MLPNELGVYLSEPDDAFEALKLPENRLVDVRTYAEWTFVGIPFLSNSSSEIICEEWSDFPSMKVNEAFVENLFLILDINKTKNIYFICRSGSRSMNAAGLMRRVLDKSKIKVNCFNVTNGFEGDMTSDRQRGKVNGWKSVGLPWLQS